MCPINMIGLLLGLPGGAPADDQRRGFVGDLGDRIKAVVRHHPNIVGRETGGLVLVGEIIRQFGHLASPKYGRDIDQVFEQVVRGLMPCG